MRNILQYPLTREECAEILDRQINGIMKSRRVGGIDAYALGVIKHFLESETGQFERFLILEQARNRTEEPTTVRTIGISFDQLEGLLAANERTDLLVHGTKDGRLVCVTGACDVLGVLRGLGVDCELL
jgi:hypothetical protein